MIPEVKKISFGKFYFGSSRRENTNLELAGRLTWQDTAQWSGWKKNEIQKVTYQCEVGQGL